MRLRKLSLLIVVLLSLAVFLPGQKILREMDGKPVYKVGNGISPPRALQMPEPPYSKEARKKHLEGVVILSLVVDETGKPRDIKVEKQLGSGLDEAAVNAVRKWTFDPAKKDGQPVRVQINVEVHFRLH